MSVVLDVKETFQERVVQEARRRNVAPQELLDHLLEAGLRSLPAVPEPADKPKTLGQLFAGRIGVIDSGGTANYSRNTGRRYAELLKARRQPQ